ncbi:DUF4926 domain-containing protein [Lyngbya sp. CCY1209]|uniref:DUF4926 domain-containing protein n=1 Tax=Lyngbya sp. CCY1209 TaxID=2886103 RepID=UPI002D216454|nr:DUF4926 domain-containing protein [Lyngbya sp. CCY1209]MEB3884298.1 DUF4926 domain-containing protein [Lyngbya sp. CCY1209]
MMKPELFDIVELLSNLPEYQLSIGDRGAIVECLDATHFEVEFSDEQGEMKALCPLDIQQFIVVWQAKTKQWLTTTDKVSLLLERLPEEKQTELLNFARSLYQQAR